MSKRDHEDVRASAAVAPLLRSIAIEIEERTRAILALESQLDALGRRRRAHLGEVGRVEAALSVERRELRLAEKELTRLGWTLAEALPACFVHWDEDGAADLAFQLAETGFRRRDGGAAA